MTASVDQRTNNFARLQKADDATYRRRTAVPLKPLVEIQGGSDMQRTAYSDLTMDNATIAAIATATGSGGIGIIKISGPQAVSIAGSIFRSKACRHPDASQASQIVNPGAREQFENHRLHYGWIIDPADERILDEVLLSVMRAPFSYTREDVIEINTHGGAVVLRSILDLVLKHGARLAEPGEFTQRAYLNGRIDLTQAEAVIDLISARTEKSLQLASAQVNGLLKEKLEDIRKTLLNLLTLNEAAIDFPDDIDNGELPDFNDMAATLTDQVATPILQLIENYRSAHVIRDGLKLAVIGKPNVGKSSLLNRLVQKDRAIVTDIPGTTRDVIEETIDIKGIPVILKDTAGLHDSLDPVESIGIKKTLEHVDGADLILFMLEAGERITSEDRMIYEQVKKKKLVVVVNKIDLVSQLSPAFIPASWSFDACVRISALYGQGMEDLHQEIATLVLGAEPIDLQETIIPNLRHKIALEKSLTATDECIEALRNEPSAELIAIHLREALDGLDEVLGLTVKIDILDQIFSRFCIGK